MAFGKSIIPQTFFFFFFFAEEVLFIEFKKSVNCIADFKMVASDHHKADLQATINCRKQKKIISTRSFCLTIGK
jgi:hypothetical protein